MRPQKIVFTLVAVLIAICLLGAPVPLSIGAYHRILRLARTIADLAGAEQIGPAHLAEGLQYRSRPTL